MSNKLQNKPTAPEMAREIVDALNSRDTGETDALSNAKDEEISAAFERHGIKNPSKQADAIRDKLSDLIGYADPFVTDEDARLHGKAGDMEALLTEFASDFEDDHRTNMESEGSWRQHRREEPNCQYCRWITEAKRLTKAD